MSKPTKDVLKFEFDEGHPLPLGGYYDNAVDVIRTANELGLSGRKITDASHAFDYQHIKDVWFFAVEDVNAKDK